jgi:hypothetical protein
MSYDDVVNSSGLHGFMSDLDIRFPSVNGVVSAIRDFAVLHGWTNPTVGGDSDGTRAQNNIAAVGPPAHIDPSNHHSCIAFDNLIGVFQGTDYQFFDPHAVPPDADPTGNLDGAGYVIKGVACGTSIAGSLGAMTGALTGGTPWIFVLSTTPDPGDGLYHGTVLAKLNGPAYNVDSFSPPGLWEPSNQNIVVGPGPTRGGWYIHSTPAPVTGDKIMIWLFEAEFGNMRIQASLNGAACNEYPLVSSFFNLSVGPYQFTFQELPGQTRDPGDVAPTTGGGGFNLVAALNVPPAYGPQTINVSGVDSPLLGTVIVHTATPHGLLVGDRVNIKNVLGTALVNGSWYVLATPLPTSMLISPDRATGLLGDGTTYVSGGVITYGIFESLVATGGLAGQFSSSAHTFVKHNGIFKSSWTSTRNTVTFDGVSMPVLNVASTDDGITSAGKPLLHAPYVMLRTQDDSGTGVREARIAGMLWDSFIQLQRHPYSTKFTYKGPSDSTPVMHMVWIGDTTTLPMVNASLVLRAV